MSDDLSGNCFRRNDYLSGNCFRIDDELYGYSDVERLISQTATQQARIEELEPLLRDAIHRIGDEGFDAIWKKQARALLEGSSDEPG